MKKILMALVVAFTTVVCNAASYDEEQLLGYWEVTSMEGYPSPEIQSFTGLYFGPVYLYYSENMENLGDDARNFHFWDGEEIEVEDDGVDWYGYGFIEGLEHDSGDDLYDVMFEGFSITNENKLHIDGQERFMQFKIEELTANSMKLVTYTQKIPCRITFKKTDKYSAAVKSVASDVENENGASYDVEGRRVSSNHKGLVISRTHGKYRKTIRKW